MAAVSLEEAPRLHGGSYEGVYLPGSPNTAAYPAPARARLLCSIADLNHLRLARQGRAEVGPDLFARVAAKRAEMLAMRRVDAATTHSPAEAAYRARDAWPGNGLGGDCAR